MRKRRRNVDDTASAGQVPPMARPSKRSRRKLRREVKQNMNIVRLYANKGDDASAGDLVVARGRNISLDEIVHVMPDMHPIAVSEFSRGLQKLLDSHTGLMCPELLEYTREVVALTSKIHVDGFGMASASGILEPPPVDTLALTQKPNQKPEETRAREATSPSIEALQAQLSTFGREITRLSHQHSRRNEEHRLALAALQTETSTLRQDMDMTRLQREQQRQWNKFAMKGQAENYQREIDILTLQLKTQERSHKDFRDLRAELAELKAKFPNGDLTPLPHQTRLDQPEFTKQSVTKTTRIHKETESAPPLPVDHTQVQVPDHVTKEVNLIMSSIKERRKRWDFFLSQQGNYMFVTNLENGLNDILRDIRQFNIRNPRAGEYAFDLLMQALRNLYKFTVAGEDATQDFLSVPLKLRAWERMDEFGAMLLRGLGWHFEHAERGLNELEHQKQKLAGIVSKRLPERSLDSWFPQTLAGLEKCLDRQQGR